MDKKEKGLHDGHRERLLDLAVNAGLDALSEYQVMEFFLTFILPRGDVNPLAHRLLNEYGDFAHVLDAESFDLRRIHGINDRAAKKISVFKDFFYYYGNSRIGKKPKINSIADLIDMVEELMRFRNNENILLVALSPANMVVSKRILDSQSSRVASIAKSELALFIANTKASGIAVAHCHPAGFAYPSGTDDDTFKQLRQICNVCGVEFIDSYIIGEDGVFSQMDDKRVRTYCDVDELKEVLTIMKNQ